MIMLDLRKVEIKQDDVWKEISFSELKTGDTFRMFEKTGEPVKDLNGRTEFVAANDSYTDEECKVQTIKIVEVE